MTIPNIVNKQAESLSVSTSAAVTPTMLSVGIYALWCTVDTYVKLNTISTIADDVTAATGYKVLASDIPIGLNVTEPAFLGAIASGSGTLYYHKA